jgi:hypothetical protein
LVPVVLPASVDPHVAAVGPTQLLQPAQKRGEPSLLNRICPRAAAHQHADQPPPFALLPARRERPCCCRATEQRDEVALV